MSRFWYDMGMPDDEDQWRDKSINVIFKGGGAKGIAYAGALEALEDRGIRLGSVAGTSAGAITASLIAAGYTSERLTPEVKQLLGSVKLRILPLIFGFTDAIFDSRALAGKLETLLRAEVESDGSGPVTFSDLYASTKITLYVVALDLVRAHPLVFSVHTTPDVSVTGAVMASSAIPAAFPSGRAIWSESPAPVVGRLADGGAWANYPRFVFFDESFRVWLERTKGISLAEERARPTIGFALGEGSSLTPPQPKQVLFRPSGPTEYDEGTLQASASAVAWLAGYLLSGRLSRLLVVASLIFSLVAFVEVMPGALGGLWESFVADPSGLGVGAALLISLAGLLGLVLMVVLVLAVVALGRPLGDVVLPSAKAALAVGTGLAPWYGEGPDEPMIQLPIGPLTTISFRVDQSVIDSVIADAKLSTEAFLAKREASDGNSSLTSPSSAVPEVLVQEPATLAHSEGEQSRLVVLAALAFSVATTAVVLVESLIVGEYLWTTGFALLFLLVGTQFVRAAARFHRNTVDGVRAFIRRPAGYMAFFVGSGLLLMVWGAFEAADYSARIEDSTQRVIVKASSPSGREYVEFGKFAYEFRSAEAHSRVTGTFLSDRRLAIGDKALVEVRGKKADGTLIYFDRYVTPMDYALPLSSEAVGGVLLVAAVWLFRIHLRDKTLGRSAESGASGSSVPA
jgi:NTE family protein